MEDEPLAEWAERRYAKVGRLRAIPLVTGDGPRGAHLNPDAPRVIQRWNGYSWEPHGCASNLAEAKRILYPEVIESPAPGSAPKLGAGTGKHRRPQAPRSER
ncbi:DUF6087 family protein [Streptomyces sp. N2A]|uniref:DUF6087 family protein n=1 Tax=Streptomyces sp. N2A TaxID=3073936 RepID=UPI00286FC099|nr:DUF6087 family protein [Streptomyces sp. N2A]